VLQGDQIWRFFNYSVNFYILIAFELQKKPKHLATFSGKNCALIFRKKLFGLDLGDFFQILVWSPCSAGQFLLHGQR
jgi:flagellar biosynthesis protein FliR